MMSAYRGITLFPIARSREDSIKSSTHALCCFRFICKGCNQRSLFAAVDLTVICIETVNDRFQLGIQVIVVNGGCKHNCIRFKQMGI